jgi:Domain of unknown function (DUF6456)
MLRTAKSSTAKSSTATSSTVTPPMSPLVQLHRRKDVSGAVWIDASAFMAGERLAADLALAGMLPKVTMDWARGAPRDRNASSAGLNPTEAALAARQRVHRALDAVGPELSGLLVDLCGFEKGLEQLERDRNWPVRSAKVAVRLALAALARHYGYGAVARGKASTGLRSWATADARPGFPTTRSQ